MPWDLEKHAIRGKWAMQLAQGLAVKQREVQGRTTLRALGGAVVRRRTRNEPGRCAPNPLTAPGGQ